MTFQAARLPSRKWSIVALASAGMATVVFSYLLLIVLAIGFLMLPFVFFLFGWDADSRFLVWRVLISAFGLVVGYTVISSLFSGNAPVDQHGVRVDLSKEPRLAEEIKAIAATFHEPMPSEVYLLADANAFVRETRRKDGAGKRRIMGMGLPLLQMLTIPQFRAVLAHEFGHYYGGDTRFGPAVYNARRSVEAVYKNLGKKSELLRFFRRWRLIAGVHRLLMGGLRAYWSLFMRVTQAISRRQELRCDELACWTAGSQALIDGLGNIRKCSVTLGSYWNSFVVPVAISGYRPDLAGFQRYMQMPEIAKAASDYLVHQTSVEKALPFDSHPLLSQRIEQARRMNLCVTETSLSDAAIDQPVVSLIDNLALLEDGLIRSVIPGLTGAELKHLNWETAGADIYIPTWRKRIEPFLEFLCTKRMADLPLLVLDPSPVAMLLPKPSTGRPSQAQRIASACDILFSAFTVCLLDNGWELTAEPGRLILTKGDTTVGPEAVIGSLRAGQLTVMGWKDYRRNRGIGDWPLASPAGGRMDL